MWEEGFQGQEMYPLRYIGISKDGKGDFAVFFCIGEEMLVMMG